MYSIAFANILAIDRTLILSIFFSSGNVIESVITNSSNSELVELVITDSIPLPKEKQIDKIKVVSVANMLAKAIEYIQKGSSMNVVYDMYKKKEKEQ